MCGRCRIAQDCRKEKKGSTLGEKHKKFCTAERTPRKAVCKSRGITCDAAYAPLLHKLLPA
jgi:hypothetical protein